MKTILFFSSLNGFLTDGAFYIFLIVCVLFAGVLIMTNYIAEGNSSQEIARLEYSHFRETLSIRAEMYKCQLKIRADTDRALRHLVTDRGEYYNSSYMKWEWEDVIWMGRFGNEKSGYHYSFAKKYPLPEAGTEENSIS